MRREHGGQHDPLKESLEELSRVADHLVDRLTLTDDELDRDDVLHGLEESIEQQVEPAAPVEAAPVEADTDLGATLDTALDSLLEGTAPAADAATPPAVETATDVARPGVVMDEPAIPVEVSRPAARWVAAVVVAIVLIGGGAWLLRALTTNAPSVPVNPPAATATPSRAPAARPAEPLGFDTSPIDVLLPEQVGATGIDWSATVSGVDEIAAVVEPPPARVTVTKTAPKAAPKPVAKPVPKPVVKAVPKTATAAPATQPVRVIPKPAPVAPKAASPTPKPAPTPAAPVAEPVVPPFKAARVLERTEPSYPPRALRRGETGSVTLKVLVGEDGKVVRVVVEQGIPGSELEGAAIDAALRWTYDPAEQHGHAIRSWVTETITFEAP